MGCKRKKAVEMTLRIFAPGPGKMDEVAVMRVGRLWVAQTRGRSVIWLQVC